MSHSLGCQSANFRVLIVDDDPSFVESMNMFLSKKYDIGVATNCKDALSQVGVLKPDVVLLDIDLGDGPDGFEALASIRSMSDPPPVLMLTGDKDTSKAVKAIKSGAFHYVCKPPTMSELVNLINLAAATGFNARRVASLESQICRLGGQFIVHDSSMKKIIGQLERVGPTDTTVLIIGETGTGKELVARHIHELSPRSSGPFVAINCAAISETLIESELFGHVRGSFTGAERDRVGLFQQAQHGTLFLDEIGHAPIEFQVRLLRALETREIIKVGGEKRENVDVRVISASSRDLTKATSEGDFKEELLYRLGVYRIDLPPLRHRRDDIIPLAEYFLGVYSSQIGRSGLEFSPAAKDYLLNHDWPGNVRRLRNTIERVAIDAKDEIITAQLLASVNSFGQAIIPSYEEAKTKVLDEFKKGYLSGQLEMADGNITEAARKSGISRSSFSRMMGEVGIRET
jgi:DNA-binding NtrC family response regulator